MARDELVQSAIDNWAPRFIANGVDANDFQRVTNSVERWDDWCQKWSECGAMHEQMGEKAEAEEHYESTASHYFHAAISYHFGKYLFVRKPHELRAAHEHTVHAYRKALPFFDFPGERVAIHGPGQGEMEFEYPMRFDYEIPIKHAIDYLESSPDVDAGRVGLMGVSLGGYYVVRAAAFERRVKATISNGGPYSPVDGFEQRPLISRETYIYRNKAANQEDALNKLKQFDLQGVAKKVECPLLVIVGRRDRLVPPEQGVRIATEAGSKAELWLFEDGNHVCNNIIYKHRPQQADWMRSKLHE